jgi:N utilization substance protein B
MKKRRISREVAMQIIFQLEAQGIIPRKQVYDIAFKNIENLDVLIGHFINNFYIKDKLNIDVLFVEELIKGVLLNLFKIDSKIDDKSDKWRLERMDSIDRSILRLSCYELFIKRKLAVAVIINEALEIAKRYGSESSSSFINGLLDALKD